MLEIKKIFKNAWNIPNILSLVRFGLVPFVGHFIYWDKIYIALSLMAFGYFLDVLDGFLARKLNKITEFGKIIDPLADKFLYAMIAVTMLLKGLVPLWFVVLYLIRELSILIGSYFFSSKRSEVPSSDKLGKISALIVALTLFFILVGFHFLNPSMLIFSLILLYISTGNYFYKSFKEINQ